MKEIHSRNESYNSVSNSISNLDQGCKRDENENTDWSRMKNGSQPFGNSEKNRASRKRSLQKGSEKDVKKTKAHILPSNFTFQGGAKEQHGHSIYCVSWSSDVYIARRDDIQLNEMSDTSNDSSKSSPSYSNIESSVTGSNDKSQGGKVDSTKVSFRYFATCGGNQTTVYEVEKDGKSQFQARQGYKDVDDGEILYACAFGARGAPCDYFKYNDTKAIDTSSLTSDKKCDDNTSNSSSCVTLSNPIGWNYSESSSQLLCVGGLRGIIKIIDPRRRSLVMTLSGHGDEIYDLQFSPQDQFLLISASKDESIRLWNIRSAACVVIFAGHEGHRDAILSLSFHPLGSSFASAGMDTSIKIWSLEGASVKRKIEESRNSSALSLTSTTSFETCYEQMPFYSTTKAHMDYVDCVHFVGDLLLSKSITNTILLWKPDLSQARVPGYTARPPRSANIIPLREFKLSQCDIWFIRFHTDEKCRLLSIGNTSGEIKVWDIGGEGEGFEVKKSLATLTNKDMQGKTIRMVTFSPDGKSLIASCDNSSIFMWNLFSKQLPKSRK